MANFGGSYTPNTTAAKPIAPVKVDPNAPKTRTVSQALGDVASKAAAKSEAYAARPVSLYTPQQVQAQQIQAAHIGTPMGAGQMSQAVDSAQANIGYAGQIDPQVAAYLRAAQQGGQNTNQSLAYLQQAAAGQGPSAAQNQLQSGVDQSIQAQMAAAASRGFSPAAMRGAQMQGAQMQQAAVNQAAQLRAQEMQAAQSAYAQGALQQEQQARQASLQAGQTTLQQQTASDEAKQAAINAYLQGSGQLLQSGTQIAGAQAQLNQQSALANQEAALKAGIFNNELGLNAQQLQQQGQLAYAGLGGNMLGTQLNAYNTLFGGQMQREASDAAFKQAILGGMISGVGAAGAAYAGKPAS